MAPISEVDNVKLIKQGAEAKLYEGTFLGRPVIIKERFKKGYRHPSLDQSLTTQRTKSEVRSMLRCRMNGVRTPVVYHVDMKTHCIYMEHITNSCAARDHIRQVASLPSAEQTLLLRPLAEKIGTVVATMHAKNLIHGDLTTSNMLVADDGELVMIDFGLGQMDGVPEDKGVDLYVLERAMLSTHPNTEWVFEAILNAYKKAYGKGVAEVMHKFEEVRLRGRKRTMLG